MFNLRKEIHALRTKFGVYQEGGKCYSYITKSTNICELTIYSFNYIVIDQQTKWRDKSKMQRNSITVHDSLDCHPNSGISLPSCFLLAKISMLHFIFLVKGIIFDWQLVLRKWVCPRVLTNPRDWVRDTARRGFDYYSSLDLDTPLDASRGAALHRPRVWRSVAFESIRRRIIRVANSVWDLLTIFAICYF